MAKDLVLTTPNCQPLIGFGRCKVERVTVGGVLGEAWNLYKRFLGRFFLTALIVFAVLDLISALAAQAASDSWSSGLLWGLVAALVSVVGYFWVQAALVETVHDVRDGRADRTIDPQVIAEQWDRMGQFYASLESGHTTASVALKRLASCTVKNRFYRANRDLGRIFKTELLLSYLSEPPLRSRIRKGLLKVEQLHALARDVYYGRRGRINARELHEQMNSCSCLTLILACVIYWQAKEISRVVRWCKPEEDKIDVALLEHISPIEWDNVILYGQYVLDRAQVR